MIRPKFLSAALVVTGAIAVAHPAGAQSPLSPLRQQPVFAPPATPDADALAASMRRLAGSPRDVDALLTAGELSLKVGDPSGAAALFRRAEQVDPMNGRVKAGMARILVTQERPGEALRYFDQAVGYGLDPRSFAGDRGLAYDLIGQGERAQRDYRLALKAGDNDEVRRRYALSLGISGKQLAAFEQLEPLIRRNDRGAWRTRAFVLALTGDVPGADRIATTMMPPAMAQALAPFFVRLPTLTPTDKAFAVHFGEVRATPERIADSRLVPTLPVLGPDPDARAQVVFVPSPPSAAPLSRRERRRRDAGRVQVAAAAAPRVVPAPMRQFAPAPGFGSAGQSPTDPVRMTSPAPMVRIAAAPVRAPQLAPAAPISPAPASPISPAPAAPISPAPAAPISIVSTSRPNPVSVVGQPTAPSPQAVFTNQTRGATLGSAPAPAPVFAHPAALPPTSSFASAATNGASSRIAPSTTGNLPTRAVPAVPAGLVARVPTGPASFSPSPIGPSPIGPATTQVATVPSSTVAPAATPLRANEDAILARIVSGLTIPGYELGVGPAPVPTPEPTTTAAAPVAVAATEPKAVTPMMRAAPDSAVRTPIAAETRSARRRSAVITPPEEGLAPVSTRGRSRARMRAAPVELAVDPSYSEGAPTAVDEPTEPRTRAGRRRAAAARALAAKTDAASDAAADTSGPRRRGADRRALAARDDAGTASKKRAGSKPTATSRDDAKPDRAEPPRIWVQVAGGANESDLPKAWSTVQSRTPALRGKQAFSTPLRSTNRVVTGPFKTDSEARAFVNQLAKQGVSAFPFTSDKGQKLKKLPPR